MNQDRLVSALDGVIQQIIKLADSRYPPPQVIGSTLSVHKDHIKVQVTTRWVGQIFKDIYEWRDGIIKRSADPGGQIEFDNM